MNHAVTFLDAIELFTIYMVAKLVYYSLLPSTLTRFDNWLARRRVDRMVERVFRQRDRQ